MDKNSTKRGLLLVAFVLSVFFLCSVGWAQDPEYGGELTVGFVEQILNLDFHVGTSWTSRVVCNQIYDKLFVVGADLAPEPQLVESYTVSPDSKEYTFILKDDIYFHDGRTLTAEDVKYTLERILDERTGSPWRSYLRYIKNIIVTAPKKLRVVLKQPDASFISSLTDIGIYPKGFGEEANPQVEAVGSGPFMLAEVTSDYVRLEKNDKYWGVDEQGNKLPYLDAVVFKVVPDIATMRAAIGAGVIDFAWGFAVDFVSYKELKGGPDTETMAAPQLGWNVIGFNCTRPPFDDVKVRQAISMAIDRQEIVDLVYFGLASPGAPMPPALKAWNPLSPEELPYHVQDVERAKELLAEAGYPDGFTFKLMPIPSIAEGLGTAQVVKDQLKAVNINVEIERVDFATFLHRWRESDFDAFQSFNTYTIDPGTYLSYGFSSDASGNIYKYHDKALDLLFEASLLVSDHAIRSSIYDAVQRRIADQAPALFLDYHDMLIAKASNVHGVILRANNYMSAERAWIGTGK